MPIRLSLPALSEVWAGPCLSTGRTGGRPFPNTFRRPAPPVRRARLTGSRASGSLGAVTAPFVLKLALSFVLGGLWITAGVALAERRGSKAGGLVLGFPSTVLAAIVFIGWTQSTEAAAVATSVIPAVHGVNALYILVAVSLMGRRPWAGWAAGLAVWGACAALVVVSGFDDFAAGILVYVVLLSFSIVRIGRMLPKDPEAALGRPAGPLLIAVRGALGGAVVAAAVLIAKLGGPLIGGVFAIFPAVFTGALLATAVSHGPAFSAAVMRSTLLGGTSCVVFAAAVRVSFVPLGLAPGAAVSALAALANTLLVRALMKRGRLFGTGHSPVVSGQ